MSDRGNPYKEGMQAAQEGRPERSNPYTRGSHAWLRWLGGHRAAVELSRQAARRAQALAAQEAK